MDVFETLAEITKPNTYLADHRDIDQIIEEFHEAIKRGEELRDDIEDLKVKIRKVIEDNRIKE